MSDDLVKRRYPEFADLRDRLGLQAFVSNGGGGHWSARLEGPRFALHLGNDTYCYISLRRPGSSVTRLADVLRQLGLWQHPPGGEYTNQLGVLEANLDQVLAALEDPAFLAEMARQSAPPPYSRAEAKKGAVGFIAPMLTAALGRLAIYGSIGFGGTLLLLWLFRR
jgi:hypothetical protein